MLRALPAGATVHVVRRTAATELAEGHSVVNGRRTSLPPRATEVLMTTTVPDSGVLAVEGLASGGHFAVVEADGRWTWIGFAA